MASERWATFDCYGTLVDWNAGISAAFARIFGKPNAPRLLGRYHELEPALEHDGTRKYRDVLNEALWGIAGEEGVTLNRDETTALADSLPDWPPFPEVSAALEELRRRDWRLAILSNSDRDLIAASQERLGVPFELAVVAGEIHSYKPAHAHWERFFEQTGADRGRHAHVAASLFHDIAPACELGLTSVWINRLGEEARPAPSRELNNLQPLPETLDELVPA
jgi:2-haloacid dehalogenase